MRYPSFNSRVRAIGLISSAVAVVAIAVTLLAADRNIGLGHSVTLAQQVFLLLAAAVLCFVQALPFLVHGHRSWRGTAQQIHKRPADM